MTQIGEFFCNRRVLVTGGGGLIGSAFVEQLLRVGARVRTVRHQRPTALGGSVEVIEGDLRDREACLAAMEGMECVVHAAGIGGGSKQVTLDAISMYTDSLLMNTQVLEAARLAGVQRYLFVSNSSVHAKSETPLREEDAWGETSRGEPENETGMVKRAGETQCRVYARFTDMRIAIMRAGNAYGPHDNFDLEASHVVPALIRKAVERQNPYMVWGSPAVVRDFIHTHDIARAGLLLLAGALPHVCYPINVATGLSVTVEELVGLVLRLAGHTNAVVQYDPSAPPASPAKRIDVSRMRAMGFQPQFTLEEGLRQTIEWFRKERCG